MVTMPAIISMPPEGEDKVYNANGEQFSPIPYDKVNVFNEDLAAVKTDRKWGYINRENVEVIPSTYALTGFFFEGKAVVCPDGKNENKLFFYFFVFPAACIIFVCDLIIQRHAI